MTGAIIAYLTLPPYRQEQFPDRDFPVSKDLVTAVAAGDWLLHGDTADRESLKRFISEWKGRYGGRPKPYSYTSGSPLLRAVPVGLLACDMDEARRTGRLVAEVSHPFGHCRNAAEAVAAAVFMASRGLDKGQIRTYLEREFGYDLSRVENPLNEDGSPNNRKVTQQAIRFFLEGTGFRKTMKRTASCDETGGLLAGIACALAEAYYGIPFLMKRKALKSIPEDIRGIILGIRMQSENRRVA